MSGRRDYYHDPAAPRANSLVPGGSALVVDEQGRVLLQRRTDSGNWALPGGTMDVGETLGDCIVRVWESPEKTVVISGNPAGLVSLARHLLTLAQDTVPDGRHLDFDSYCGWLEGGSAAIRIEIEKK
ncbi:NUDIX domain-containing protein [Actinoplanes sp. NPDC051470]|uniref:Imm32 family immunity protein n=1 Tax=Actinoplanes sp. NPDC051470 TaxID=3157224 RepID=UPI00341819D2